MKCPTCFGFLPLVPAKLLCVGSCNPEERSQATAVRGYEVRTKTLFDAPSSSPGDPTPGAACPECGQLSSQEACGYCYAPVPPHWRAAKVTCVAMAGARATGKSLMMAVAKEQLALLVERHYGSALTGIASTDGFFYNNYTRTLYDQRMILAPTAPAQTQDTTVRVPMMFQFSERLPDGSARTRVLVLRDVAGEDLEAGGGSDASLRFYSRADAVIALIDPLTVSQIRALLADLIPGDTRTGGDGTTVLRHVLGLMTGGAPGARTSIPLAVVLSKFDTIQRLADVKSTTWARIMSRPGSPMQRDPSLRSPWYDDLDGDLLHEEVRGMLEQLNAQAIPALLRDTSDRYHYFATSALGESPEGQLIHSGGIAPFRVLDPFKWALHVTG